MFDGIHEWNHILVVIERNRLLLYLEKMFQTFLYTFNAAIWLRCLLWILCFWLFELALVVLWSFLKYWFYLFLNKTHHYDLWPIIGLYFNKRRLNFSNFKWVWFATRNGILLPKLFWPTVRITCSSDQEKLLKFEAEGQEFAKFLRSLEQFIQTVKGQKNFW